MQIGYEVCWPTWYVSTSRHIFIGMDKDTELAPFRDELETADKCTPDSSKAIVGRAPDGHWYIKINRVKMFTDGPDAEMSPNYVRVRDIRIRQ